MQIGATNVSGAIGGEGADNVSAYGQVSSSLFVAKIAPNTTTEITATFSKGGDWRCLTAMILPF